MHLPYRRLLVLSLLALCIVCLPLAGQKASAPPKPVKPALDKPALEAYLRHLFVWGPNIKVEIVDPTPSQVSGLREITVRISAQGASAEHRFMLSSDGRRLIQGSVYDLKDNPFRPELSKLTTESQPSLGTPGAPVVLALFTDFQCPYCRQEAKMLHENLLGAYPKEVRLYFKDFPLDQMHPWARPAAIAGRCIFRQNPETFWLYHDWVFTQQDQITAENLRPKIMDFARGKEIDILQLGRCLDTKATEAEVNKSVAEGIALNVDGTPTLFINGRRLGSHDWPQLRAFIDNEIEYQKTAKNAGDRACCQVKPPSPLSK